MTIQRWRFRDMKTGETYTVPLNPNAMTSPYPPRQFTYKGTTAGANGGRAVTYEAWSGVQEWQFSGSILDENHFRDLLRWSYCSHKVQVTDHLGRTFVVVFKQFEPTPKRSYQYKWHHDYTMHAGVYWTPATGLAP